MKSQAPYKPRPILTPTMLEQTIRELGGNPNNNDDIAKAVQLCSERYWASPETKAAQKEQQRQEALRKKMDEDQIAVEEAREAEWQRKYREAEEAGLLPLTGVAFLNQLAQDAMEPD